MERMTKALGKSGFYAVEEDKVIQDKNGCTGEAIDRLAKFENFYENLVAEQTKLGAELEKLRMEDKTHTVKFKQLLVNKLNNTNVISLLESFGLK